jgi:uncharacterized membrane protein
MIVPVDRHPERALDRVIAFSDAVVAIAMTLLVLPLTELSPSDYDGDVGRLLSDNSSELTAFVVSFFVIALFWASHHRIFDRLVVIDGRLLRLNILWLFTIVVLPFPSSLVQTGGTETAAVFYLGALFVTALMTRVIAIYVARHPALCDGPEDEASRAGAIRGWFAVAVFAVAFVASFWMGVTATWLLLVMLAEGPVSALVARRHAAS